MILISAIKRSAPHALPTVAALLAAVLCAQTIAFWNAPHRIRASASWAQYAGTLAQAEALSSQIVVARVTNVAPAPDIQVPAEGEPADTDRVPIEIVTLNVIRSIKNPTNDTQIRLFHTALTYAGRSPLPQGSGGLKRPPPRPDAGIERTSILEDDPPYFLNQTYLLFLTSGPTVEERPTVAVIAPEGRYLIARPDVLRAVTRRGAARRLDGRRLSFVFPVRPSPSPTPTTTPSSRSTTTPPPPPGPRIIRSVIVLALILAFFQHSGVQSQPPSAVVPAGVSYTLRWGSAGERSTYFIRVLRFRGGASVADLGIETRSYATEYAIPGDFIVAGATYRWTVETEGHGARMISSGSFVARERNLGTVVSRRSKM